MFVVLHCCPLIIIIIILYTLANCYLLPNGNAMQGFLCTPCLSKYNDMDMS